MTFVVRCVPGCAFGQVEQLGQLPVTAEDRDTEPVSGLEGQVTGLLHLDGNFRLDVLKVTDVGDGAAGRSQGGGKAHVKKRMLYKLLHKNDGLEHSYAICLQKKTIDNE
ncbi:MAG: hypothetical protein VZR28_05730 [Candidatus Cryptobacteroides sp.]|nr:hypothetical protein [Candidatus Cryptobacteroides sp.]